MKSLTTLLLFVMGLACLMPRTMAQTQSLALSVVAPSQVTVTFTFQSSLADYSVSSGENGDHGYYVRVSPSNIPSYKITPAGSKLRVSVRSDESNGDSVVFAIPVNLGSTPRIDRSGSDLSFTFIPPVESAEGRAPTPAQLGNAETTSKVSRPNSAASANSSAATSPGSSATPVLAPSINQLASAKPFEVDKKLLAFADADLAVPESPAFTVLGLTPETVVRPTSPREFASSLLNGVDPNGNFQSGVALDFAPYLSLAADQMTLGQYRSSYKLRFLSRTQFSFATTKGASAEDKSARLGLGLRFTLWDRGDPHSDEKLMTCFTGIGRALFNIPPPNVLPPDQLPAGATQAEKDASAAAWQDYDMKQKAFDDSKNAGYEKCRAEGRARNWNKSSWIVALAPSWISTTGQTKNLKWNGGGFWTSVAYGFEGIPSLEKHSQMIFHARYRNNEQVPDPNNKGKFLNQDSFFLGTRLRVGGENSTVSFEGSLVRSRPDGKTFDNSARYSVGLERRVAENLWFALAFGGDSGRSDHKNNSFVLTSFKWGFSPKRNFDPAPGK